MLACKTRNNSHAQKKTETVFLVQRMGFEPTQPCGHWYLKPARMPFRHLCKHNIISLSHFFVKNIYKAKNYTFIF